MTRTNGQSNHGGQREDSGSAIRRACDLWNHRERHTSDVLRLRRAIAPSHLADLRKSGLSDATIRACRFHSIEGDEVGLALNWAGGGRNLGACLCIPFFDRHGRPLTCASGREGQPRPVPYVRMKPDRPLGPGRKYEQPKGVGIRLYVPPMAWPLIDDPDLPLLITEGEKKACKAVQEGFACVGLLGVDCWSAPRPKSENGRSVGPRQLHADLLAVLTPARRVLVCFDSDAATNRSVLRAEKALTGQLAAFGAVVGVVRLPADKEGLKCGLDDFLTAYGAEGLRRLVETECANLPLRGGGGGDLLGEDSRTPRGKDPEADHRLRVLLGLPFPPPASACRLQPGSSLRHREKPDKHLAVRFRCDGWGCRVCYHDRIDLWALHLARCAAGALAGGRKLWLLEAPARRVKAIAACVGRRVSKRGADYARVKGDCNEKGESFHYLVAMAGRPHPSAVEAGDTADGGNLEARLTLIGWLRAIPDPANEKPFSATRRQQQGRQRQHPVTTSARWALLSKEKSDYSREFNLQCRDLATVLEVFGRFRVGHGDVREDFESFAFRVGWVKPGGWSEADVEQFKAALRQARDDADNPNAPRREEGKREERKRTGGTI